MQDQMRFEGEDMQVNFMEELAAEWFEYLGYIVKRNEHVGPLSGGGYEGELDIVAFNPKKNHLVHIETSADADSWTTRERRFSKKFESGAKYIGTLFEGLTIPDEVERRAIFVFGSDKNHKAVGGGRVQLAKDLILEILNKLKGITSSSRAVPEKYPILRVLQMITDHRKKIVQELGKK